MEGSETSVLRVAVFALAGLLAGGGGSAVYNTVRDPRPNPYTSLDGARDQVEVYRRLDRQRDKAEQLAENMHRLELMQRDIASEIHLVRVMLDRHFGPESGSHPEPN